MSGERGWDEGDWADVSVAEDELSGVARRSDGGEARWVVRVVDDELTAQGLPAMHGPDGKVVVVDDGDEQVRLYGWMPEHLQRMTPAMARGLSADARAGRERLICVCGHAARRHSKATGRCRPPRWQCDCREARPVVAAQDTRMFLFASQGSLRHALTRGMSKSAEKGLGWRWLDGQPRCEFCGTIDAGCRPVIVNTKEHTMVLSPAKAWSPDTIDVLICQSCCTEQFPDSVQWLWGPMS